MYITQAPLSADTLYHYSLRMIDQNQSVFTPSGTHITINAQTSYTVSPIVNTGGTYRKRDSRYAQGIGIVVETLPFFSHSPDYKERRLIRYHLNN